jgi:hypothetical protein
MSLLNDYSLSLYLAGRVLGLSQTDIYLDRKEYLGVIWRQYAQTLFIYAN